jgi:nitronate monooxygenase
MSGDIHALRAQTRAPFGVNLFVLSTPDVDQAALRAYVERLRAAEAARYETDPAAPRFEDDDWDAKLVVLGDDPVPVV